jgi:hypothetical protein
LTAAARDGDGNMQSRRKNARGAGQTKEWNDKGRQKWRDAPLTKKARMREICLSGCVSSEGWRVQQEVDLPG